MSWFQWHFRILILPKNYLVFGDLSNSVANWSAFIWSSSVSHHLLQYLQWTMDTIGQLVRTTGSSTLWDDDGYKWSPLALSAEPLLYYEERERVQMRERESPTTTTTIGTTTKILATIVSYWISGSLIELDGGESGAHFRTIPPPLLLLCTTMSSFPRFWLSKLTQNTSCVFGPGWLMLLGLRRE